MKESVLKQNNNTGLVPIPEYPLIFIGETESSQAKVGRKSTR